MSVQGRSDRLMVRICKTAVIVAVVFAAGCFQESSQFGGQAGTGQPSAVKPMGNVLPEGNLLAEGAALFATYCTSCHGTAGNGRGNMGGPSLQRPHFSYGRNPAAITQSIRDGRPGGMPSFSHVFTPRQLDALTTYILSLKK